jgi:glucokinase
MTLPYYIGVDIGGTKIAVSIFDVASSTIIEKETFPTNRECDPGNAVNRISEIALRWISNRAEPPKSVGISVGGMFDVPSGCMRHAPHLPLWDDFPIVARIRDSIQVPVYAENDANACALAEWQYGAGKGYQHLVFLTFGTGLGGGLILNGQLYRGACGLSGEVGAIRVSDDGPPVRGNPGCLEGFASGAGIAMYASSLLAGCENPTLPRKPTAKEIAEAAKAGDAFSIALLEECGRQLGRGLAILIDVLNPEAIVLGSIFARCESYLRPAMEAAIARDAMPQTARVCRIVAAELGESLGDVAAATVAKLGVCSEPTRDTPIH